LQAGRPARAETLQRTRGTLNALHANNNDFSGMNSDSDRNLNPSHCDTNGMRMEWAGGIPVTFDRFGTRGMLDSHACGAHRSRGVDIASSGRVPERMWHAHAGARKLASRHPAAVRGRRMRALRTLAGRRMHIAVGKALGKQQPWPRKPSVALGLPRYRTQVR
jgi:hypothetical protein